MTDPDKLDAAGRVQAFLDDYQTIGGLDHEDIHSLHVGTAREAHLFTSDLRDLVAAARERDELREALKIIAADRPDWTPESISVKARNIARAALNRAALHREHGA